jgi:hypothetical protein
MKTITTRDIKTTIKILNPTRFAKLAESRNFTPVKVQSESEPNLYYYTQELHEYCRANNIYITINS